MQLFLIMYATLLTLVAISLFLEWLCERLWEGFVAWTRRVRGTDKYIVHFPYQVKRALREAPLDWDVRKAERARKPLTESQQQRLTEWLQEGVDYAIGLYVIMRGFGRE